MKNINKHPNTVADMNNLSAIELSNILYHIAENTRVSQQYTREFITKCLLKASELLGQYNTLTKVHHPLSNNLKNCGHFTKDHTTLPTGSVPNLCMWHRTHSDPDIVHTVHPCAFIPQIDCLCCEDGIRMCMQP